MQKLKTSVTLSHEILAWIDNQIKKKRFASRSHAVEYALTRLIEKET
jgi:Arc/MetJ-type ribon-helix-helix transcriptional regulator